MAYALSDFRDDEPTHPDLLASRPWRELAQEYLTAWAQGTPKEIEEESYLTPQHPNRCTCDFGCPACDEPILACDADTIDAVPCSSYHTPCSLTPVTKTGAELK